jgi:hypothetical protein
LGVTVLSLALRSLVVLQRAVRHEQARTAARGTLLDAVHTLRADLADVDPAGGDLVVAEPARMVYRAVRATGVVCRSAADTLVLERSSFRALRGPAPGRDSVLMLPPDQPGGWSRAAVTGGTQASTCAGHPALAIPVRKAVPQPGTFVRIFETIEIRFYASGGEWWMGYRSVSGGETVQPIAGPFVSGSFGFEYLGAAGTAASPLARTRTLRFRATVRHFNLPGRDSLRVALPLAGAGGP